MMLSKITISITIFIAVVFFKRSESIDVEDCISDNEFLTVAKKYRNENRFYIPIVVTKWDPTSLLDSFVEDHLISNGYKIYVRVHVDDGICPVTNSVLHVRHYSLLSNEKYPRVFMMVASQLLAEMWYQESSTDIDVFLRSALEKRPGKNPYMESVVDSMEAGIASKNRMDLVRSVAAIQMKDPSQNLPQNIERLRQLQKKQPAVKPLTILERRNLSKIPNMSLPNCPLNRVGRSTNNDPNYYSRTTPIIRTTQQLPTQQARNIESNVGKTNSGSDLNQGVPFVDKGKSPIGTETEHKRTGSGFGTGYYRVPNPNWNFEII